MRRLNINLYDDEYKYIKDRSEAERVSMNKVFQFMIRDELKGNDTKMTPKSMPRIIKTKDEIPALLTNSKQEPNICKHGSMKGLCKFGCK